MMHTVIVMLPRKSKKERNKLFNLIIIENVCFLFCVHIYFCVVGCSVISYFSACCTMKNSPTKNLANFYDSKQSCACQYWIYTYNFGTTIKLQVF